MIFPKKIKKYISSFIIDYYILNLLFKESFEKKLKYEIFIIYYDTQSLFG